MVPGAHHNCEVRLMPHHGKREHIQQCATMEDMFSFATIRLQGHAGGCRLNAPRCPFLAVDRNNDVQTAAQAEAARVKEAKDDTP